jgi:hypothetical protein
MSGWQQHLVRARQVAVVAFVVLQLKELRDAGHFDTPATATDAGLIAGGTFLVDLVLGMMKRRSPAAG